MQVNGIDLYYEVEGTGAPLLLLHGMTGCSGDWVYALLGNSPQNGADCDNDADLLRRRIEGRNRPFAAMGAAESAQGQL